MDDVEVRRRRLLEAMLEEEVQAGTVEVFGVDEQGRKLYRGTGKVGHDGG